MRKLFGIPPDRRSSTAPCVCALDQPSPHDLRLGATNRFSGFALNLSGAPYSRLEARADGVLSGEFPADLASPDLAALLPRIDGSGRCRFDFPLEVDARTDAIEIVGVPGSAKAPTAGTRLFVYPVGRVREEAETLRRRAEALQLVPLPPPEFVAATQGGDDARAYARSIVPSIWTLERVLEEAGIDPDDVADVLDFGCGTGRLLLSWWLQDRERTLRGCDLNGALIEWGRAHLPAGIEVRATALDPPLPYPGSSFDLVQAVSVFTHLSWERQERWVAELSRILRPGGVLLATLHGPLYVELLGDEAAVRAFAESGYLEGRHATEGSNAFATFHSRKRAAELFAGLEVLAHLPRGEMDGERPLAPLAMYQDVYVLRRPTPSSSSSSACRAR
jgi:SAM-dependent methyltransferase